MIRLLMVEQRKAESEKEEARWVADMEREEVKILGERTCGLREKKPGGLKSLQGREP